MSRSIFQTLASLALVTVIVFSAWPAPAAALERVPAVTAALACADGAPTWLRGPGGEPPSLCQRSFCWDEGVRCFSNGTGPGGCCSYDDCGPDLSCVAPDPLPPNICQ